MHHSYPYSLGTCKSAMQDSSHSFNEQLSFSVIIPAYNEEGSIEPLYRRLTAVLTDLAAPYEIIFVDDGSKDSTFQVMKKLFESDSNVKVVQLTRNFGQHPALLAGFRVAKNKVIITLDADMQNPPEEIPKLLDKLKQGHEIVFGIPAVRKHSLFKRSISFFARWFLAKILPVNATSISGFRMITLEVIQKLLSLEEKDKFLDGLLCWMGYNIAVVYVKHDVRKTGQAKYTLFKMLGMWFDIIVSFTNLPLKIATFGGIFFGVIGIILAVLYLARYFFGGYAVPGFATTIITVTVFSGVQLFCLGILGEYIGRMNKELKNKPDYVTRQILSR